MADSTEDIVIRPFDTRKDLKEAQLLVGMGAMEQLALANRKAYFHPVAVSIWLVFAGTIIQALNLWPTGSGPNGWLGYLAPLPTMACTAVPLLFAIDWLHRPHFENLLKVNIQNFTKAVATPRPTNPPQNPPHLLTMEYKNSPIGCIFLQPTPSTNRTVTYRITHFHVDVPYRRAGVGNDLLSRAIEDLERSKGDVVGVTTCLTPYVAECLSAAGFVQDNAAVRVWDQGRNTEAGSEENTEVAIDEAKVLFVDTRRTGWRLRRT